MKYKQQIIPETHIPNEWAKLKGTDLRKFVVDYIISNYKGLVIRNEHTQIDIKVTVKSGRKTAYGEAMYSKKAALVFILPELIKYAQYNNFGNRKPTDSDEVLGYLNFKAKCRIDGELAHIRIAVQFQKGGKFYYNVEVNKKASSVKGFQKEP